jgi:hypothetical protein
VALGSATGTTVDLAYPTSSTAKRQFRAMATDTAGNASPWALGPAFRVLAFQNGSAPVAQSGKWKSRSSSSFYGKSARSSSALGARQVLNIVASDFAIVSTLGPNRGRFEVYVDGNYRQTIDLYAPTTSFRRVVYAIDFGASGSHRIDLRVTHTKSASSSGYRVDFDAFLALAP